jgi:hypothetical protein
MKVNPQFQPSNAEDFIMKWKVQCITAGNRFYVECYAGSYDEAKRVAKAQYPNTTIIGAQIAW